MRELKLGTLTARVTGGTDREGGGTGPVVVLLHGYGAPGTDLVPLWRELAVPHEVRFVFPEAPLELGFGGRAWWPLDMARLQDRFSKAAVERLIAEVPPGIDEARAALLELLAVLERDFGALPEQTVLGGFSQGAMLATDIVLRSSAPLRRTRAAERHLDLPRRVAAVDARAPRPARLAEPRPGRPGVAVRARRALASRARLGRAARGVHCVQRRARHSRGRAWRV